MSKLLELIDVLPRGEENAVSADELRKRLHVRPERTQFPIRDLARQANLAGFPVVSSRRGFFLATRKSELDDYCENLRKRMWSIDDRLCDVSRLKPWED